MEETVASVGNNSLHLRRELFSPLLTLSWGGILSIIHSQRCVVFCFWVNRTAYFSGSGSMWCFIGFPEVLACAARNSSSCKKRKSSLSKVHPSLYSKMSLISLISPACQIYSHFTTALNSHEKVFVPFLISYFVVLLSRLHFLDH